MIYVVIINTFVQDGSEEHAYVFGDLESVKHRIEQSVGYEWGCRSEARLFELGKEIPLTFETVYEEQPPPKKGVKVSLGGQTKLPKRGRK